MLDPDPRHSGVALQRNVQREPRADDDQHAGQDIAQRDVGDA